MGSSCAESAFTQYRRNKIHSKQIKTVPSFEIGQIIDSKGHPIRLSLLSYQLENISFSTQVVLIKIEILHDMLLVEGLRIPFSLDVDLEDDATAQAQDQCPPHQFNRVVLVGITNIGCGTHIIQQVLGGHLECHPGERMLSKAIGCQLSFPYRHPHAPTWKKRVNLNATAPRWFTKGTLPPFNNRGGNGERKVYRFTAVTCCFLRIGNQKQFHN